LKQSHLQLVSIYSVVEEDFAEYIFDDKFISVQSIVKKTQIHWLYD